MNKYRYPFTNAIVFSQVMRDPELCKGLLQWIFPDREIAEVRHHRDFVTTEVNLFADVETKSTQLYVLFKDTNAWYDIEMQVETERVLPHRSRYYHSMMDVQQLDRGDMYENLHDSFVIFLCCYDPFGLGLPQYRFESHDPTNHLSLPDGRYTIIMNSRADESMTPDPLQKLFRYMNESIITEADPLLLKIDDSVQYWNSRKGVAHIMRLEQEMERTRIKAYRQGVEEGIEQGIAETAKRMKDEGVAADIIMRCTGLTAEEIDALDEAGV